MLCTVAERRAEHPADAVPPQGYGRSFFAAVAAIYFFHFTD
jgi:hypothetical protein